MFGLIITLFCLLSCRQQPKMVFQINSLKEKEIKVYYDVKGYPALSKDSLGNYVVFLDTATILYTSTRFDLIKNHQNIFCFKNINEKCYKEDSELEADGFIINVYSYFTFDTTNKKLYINPYDKILIERIK